MTLTPEEQRIVEWLRDDAGKTRDDLCRLHSRKKLTPRQTEEWETLISLKCGIAAAIERGEHRKGDGSIAPQSKSNKSQK